MKFVGYNTEFPDFRTTIIGQIGIDGVRKSRRWVDTVSGLTLRERYTDDHDPQTVILDVVINSLEVNPVFPPDLLKPHWDHPLRENFAEDFPGKIATSSPELHDFQVNPLAWRVPKTHLLTPIDFDSSGSQLTFEIVDEDVGRDHNAYLCL